MADSPASIQHDLALYIPRLNRLMHEANEATNAWLGAGQFPVAPRTRANMMYDAIIAKARQEFAGDVEVTFSRRKGLILMYIRDESILRFKKLDRLRRGQSIRTKQTVDYSSQRPMEGMPPTAARYVVGYQLDPSGTQITATWATLPKGDGIPLALRLDTVAEKVTVTLVPIQTPAPPARIRRKRDKTQEANASDELGGQASS